jgi:hypothetical protein
MIDLPDWVLQLNAELGTDVPPEVITAVLKLARDAAHGIARPAAPLSTFLVGYAAGRAAHGSFDLAPALALIERARALARGEAR